MVKGRLQTLDGLRFIAAFGVLWIHCWTYFGNQRWIFHKIDLTNFLAIGGNGVDLFFVISGFCMYYFYASKRQFSYHDFFRFLVKRWIRLSPAFYAATLVYVLYSMFYLGNPINGFAACVTSIFYLNSVLPQYNAAGHFWTLGVEWQFYVIIPFLLLYQNKIGFKKTYCLIFGGIIILAIAEVIIFKARHEFLTDQLLFRAMEFGAGTLVARILLVGRPAFKNRALWLFLSLIIVFAGRTLISKSVLILSPDYHQVFKLAGFSLMGVGFSILLFLVITSDKWLKNIFGSRIFRHLGKMSYSFYLWHGLTIPIVTKWLFPSHGVNIAAPMQCTIVCTIILFPLSELSYRLLEKPFLSVGNLTTK